MPLLKLHRDGENMTYYDEQSAETAHEVADVYVRTRKHAVSENEVGAKHGQTAFCGVAEEVDDAYFKPESTHHVHGARVAAALLAYIAVFELGYDYGEVETTDEVAHYRRD